MYTLDAAATVVSVHPLYSTICTMMLVWRFNVAQFVSIVVFFLQTPHWSTLPSSNFHYFLYFPPSFLLYHCLAPSHSWWVWALLWSCPFCWLLIVVLLFVISPWWIWWMLFSNCQYVTTVLYARTVRAAWYGSFHAPAVQYRLYHAYCRCITTVLYACTGCIVR